MIKVYSLSATQSDGEVIHVDTEQTVKIIPFTISPVSLEVVGELCGFFSYSMGWLHRHSSS